MRTLDEALQRAEVLRAFRDTNSERFDRNQDFADIVILADEVKRLSRDEDDRNLEAKEEYDF